MRSIIYPRAGKIVLRKYGSDGKLSDEFIAGNGTVQSIAANVSIATTELADGNSDFPMGVYDTGKTGQIVVTMSSFQPTLYAALMGSDIQEKANDYMWAADKESTIPSESPYEIELDYTPRSGGSIVVVDKDASPFVKTESVTGEGQFAVSGNTLQFSVSNAGEEVFITYDFDKDNVTELSLPAIGVRPVMQAIVSTEATDEDEINEYIANIIVDKCKATGDINQPTQQREPQNWSFTLGVLKPRAGFNPVYWKYAKK